MPCTRRRREGYGYEATEDQLGWSVPLYVAETDEIARREAQPHIETFLNKFLRMPRGDAAAARLHCPSSR